MWSKIACPSFSGRVWRGSPSQRPSTRGIHTSNIWIVASFSNTAADVSLIPPTKVRFAIRVAVSVAVKTGNAVASINGATILGLVELLLGKQCQETAAGALTGGAAQALRTPR